MHRPRQLSNPAAHRWLAVPLFAASVLAMTGCDRNQPPSQVGITPSTSMGTQSTAAPSLQASVPFGSTAGVGIAVPGGTAAGAGNR